MILCVERDSHKSDLSLLSLWNNNTNKKCFVLALCHDTANKKALVNKHAHACLVPDSNFKYRLWINREANYGRNDVTNLVSRPGVGMKQRC